MSGPVHEGLLCTSADEFAADLGPRIVSALDAGGSVVALLDGAHRSALTRALGTHADAAEFVEPILAARVPAFTAASRTAGICRRAGLRGQRSTVISQQGEDPAGDAGYWPRMDAALTVALAGLPAATMLCVFGARLLAAARRTHPTIVEGGRSAPNADYLEPSAVLATWPPPGPPELGRPALEHAFSVRGLPGARRQVHAVLAAASVGGERASDFVLAVNEIASNSVEHGAGTARLRAWTGPTAVVCEILDAGTMTVDFPGLVPPSPTGERGRGLWLASELTDGLQIWRGPDGTRVRLTLYR